MLISYNNIEAFSNEVLQGQIRLFAMESAEVANEAQALTISHGIVVATGAGITGSDMTDSYFEWLATRE